MKKADWLEFRGKIAPPPETESFASTDEANKYLTESIIDAAHQSIPRSSPTHKHKPEVPWWNKKCSTERKIVRNAYGRMRRNPSANNITTYRRRQAIKRRTFKQEKRESWRRYTSGLTTKTPCKLIWAKI